MQQLSLYNMVGYRCSSFIPSDKFLFWSSGVIDQTMAMETYLKRRGELTDYTACKLRYKVYAIN